MASDDVASATAGAVDPGGGVVLLATTVGEVMAKCRGNGVGEPFPSIQIGEQRRSGTREREWGQVGEWECARV